MEGRSLRANMAWNTAGSLAYHMCQWLVMVLTARVTGSYEAAGVLALAMSISNIFTPFALYRMRAYQVSDLEEEHTAGEYLGFRLVTCGIAFAACMVYSLATCPASSLPCIALYLLFKSAEQVIDVLAGLEQQRSRLDLAGRSMLLRGFGTLGAFLAAAAATRSVEWGVAAMLAATLAVLAAYDAPTAEGLGPIRPRWNTRSFARLFGRCLPAVAAAVAAGAVLTIPKQQLGVLWGDAALGVYSTVAAPVAVIQLGASCMYSPLLGRIADAYHSGDKKRLCGVLAATGAGTALLAVFALAAAGIGGQGALALLLGADMAAHADLLAPMILCAVCTVALMFAGDVLLAVREFKGSCVSGVLALTAALILSAPLVERAGMNGVSLVGITANGAGAAAALLFLWLRMRGERP